MPEAGQELSAYSPVPHVTSSGTGVPIDGRTLRIRNTYEAEKTTMSKIFRLTTLVTALASLFAVLSSTAGAVTWTNTGATTFHATGSSVTFGITASATQTNNLSCPDATATGTAPMDFTTITGTITFTDCKLVGLETHYGCTYTLTPQAFTALTPAVTDSTISVNCSVKLQTTPFTTLCTITGTVPVTYTNPNGATPGRMTLLGARAALNIANESGSSCSSAGVPAGATRPVDLSHQTFTLTDALGPVIATA